jgi:hypothetical protein
MYNQLNTPILFLVFNRPGVTSRVFEVIKKIKPKRLYIASDGARLGKSGEIEKVNLVRKIVTTVDWPCKTRTLFSKYNLGCKIAVSYGIKWFFENEEEGIILEDDCLPHLDFFLFCEKLLEKYRNDERILTITGDNFQNGTKHGSKSYYFSKYFHCWGWATWRRTWDCYDGEIKFWQKWKQSADWINKFPEKIERKYWSNLFDQIYLNKIDTWDFPFLACLWKKGGLNLIPNVNLVSNIGFGEDATHTISSTNKNNNLPATSIGDLTHPTYIEQCQVADTYTFNNTFGGRHLRMPWLLFKLPMRAFKYFLRKLKKISI